jgi:serpin B
VDPRLVTAYTGFGLKLFHSVARDAPEENLFLAPTSVAFALAMTYNGAAGETRAAMQRVLQVEGLSLEEVNRANAAWRASLASPDPKVELSVANSLWARQGVPFRQDFLQRNQEFYGARAAALDFAAPTASRTINDWVREGTRGRITEIVPDRIDPRTVMYLINAIYFKGSWSDPFDPKLTRAAPFTLPGGGTRQVQMMSRDGSYRLLDGEGFRALALPYGSGRLAMYLFLPDEGASLADLYRRLTPAEWEGWMQGFREQRVLLSLPRFRLEYELALVETLKGLGMEVAFDPQRADFEGMLPREYLRANNAYISDVKHKTFVEVNELGTEAAGATSVEIGVVSLPPQFVVDRPFFVAIRDDRTGTVLFMGQIVDPR